MKSPYTASVLAVLLALVCSIAYADDLQFSDKFDDAPVELIEIGGKLLVDLHADLMLTTNDQRKALNWFNAGYLWGTFGDFGFARPASQYPTAATVAGCKAVTFNGRNWLKGSMTAPESITGSDDFSAEVWALNPSVQPNECLVSWAANSGFVLYPDEKTAPAGEWHHIVLVYTGGEQGEKRLYVDGVLKSREAARLDLPKGGVFYLGCAPDGKRKFSGSIAAVRIHEKAMTEQQVAHNHAGGINLGTVLLPNIDEKNPNDPTWGSPKNPKVKAAYSKHFRVMWEPAKDEKNVMTDQTVRRMLDEYEQIYDLYTHRMGMHPPIVSAHKERRGDGRKYKINVCINWDGGAFGGFNGELGFGYPIHGPGIAHAHELGHAYQMHQMGGLAGNWWETHTSWMAKCFEGKGRKFNYANAYTPTAMFFVSNGRNYYHCYHIFEQLGLDPEFGPLFIAKLWNTPPRDAYPFLRAEEIEPTKVNALAEQWVKMARRHITWDYPDADKHPKEGPTARRMDRTLLEPIPYQPGTWRVPKDFAPQQFGYNICPLAATAKTVTVDLGGYVDPERGSAWRACLAAVNGKNEARYGSIWSKGKNTFRLKPDEKELYLAVAATPKTMMIDMTGDCRSFEQHQLPYTVKLEGAAPKDIFIPPKPTQAGHKHPNGGGFVADTATVDATAYVGPNAQVLDNAKVLGNARIEDCAVVCGRTEVSGHAIVNGHGYVCDNAVVRDYAKVRDFGVVSGSGILRNYAKVAEHGVDGGKASEYAVIKGVAASFGSNYGTSIVDGMYAKSNEVSKGMWLTWSWSTGKNPGELDEDLGGLYVQYLFDKKHPYLALDTYGVTYGYLMGNPVQADGVLTLNGKDQFVEMPKDVADLRDITIVLKVKWNGGAKNQRLFEFAADKENRTYLTPAGDDGKLTFAIVKDGKAQVLKAKDALPVGDWAEVKVMLSEDTGTLYVNGNAVDENTRMTLNPEDVRATTCYLGRGLSGDYFDGQIDTVSVYSIAQVDKVAPKPDPAAWYIEPTMACDSKAIMYTETGCDPLPGVEYLFEETSGTGHTSGWQKSPVFEDKGLKPGVTYSYTVKMRDALGNETQPSPAKSVRWESSPAYIADAAPGGVIFVMEAEHYQKLTQGKYHEWRLQDILEGYRGEGAMYASPEAGPSLSDFRLEAPRLDYRLRVEQPGRYFVWVRGYGRYYYSNTVWVSIDGQEPRNLATGWMNQKYRWMNTGKDKPFEIDAAGVHTLTIWMDQDAVSVDAILVTNLPPDQYSPTDEKDVNGDLVGKGPAESRLEKDGRIVSVDRAIPRAQWSSLRPVMLSGSRAVMQARNCADRLSDVEYLFEETTGNAGGKSSGWQKEPYYENTGLSPQREYAYRVKIRSNGSESDWSDTVGVKWNPSGAFVESAKGMTVIEAEHFSRASDAPSGNRWELSKAEDVYIHPGYGGWTSDRTDAPFSGEGYMQTTPIDGLPAVAKSLAAKARLDFDVKFVKAGPHWVWVRGSGEHWLCQNVSVGLDMKVEEWGKDVPLNWTGFRWVRSGQFTVPAPGVYTISIWMQQDAVVVDKLIITTDEKYLPSKEIDPTSGAPNGVGPAESPRAGP